MTTPAWITSTVDGAQVVVRQPAEACRGVVVVLPSLEGELSLNSAACAAALDRHALVAVGIRTSGCWWPRDGALQPSVTWLRLNLTKWIADRWSVSGPVALVGLEAGGQAALRLAYWYPNEFPVVAAIDPAIDFHRCLKGYAPTPRHKQTVRELYDDPEAARQETATLHIHPLNWPRHQYFCSMPASPWWEGAERLRMKLASLGVPHTCDLQAKLMAAGEYVELQLPSAIDFVAERLDAERRRQ